MTIDAAVMIARAMFAFISQGIGFQQKSMPAFDKKTLPDMSMKAFPDADLNPSAPMMYFFSTVQW
jgi:hypothetical protein